MTKQREIKFRAWDKEKNRIILFDEIMFRSEYNCLEFGCDWDKYKFTYGDLDLMDNAPIMQFTGLKDKNGKEIYEGDIVKDLNRDIGEVFWYITGFMVKYPKGIMGLTPHEEIIGNIYESPYENPELLK